MTDDELKLILMRIEVAREALDRGNVLLADSALETAERQLKSTLEVAHGD